MDGQRFHSQLLGFLPRSLRRQALIALDGLYQQHIAFGYVPEAHGPRALFVHRAGHFHHVVVGKALDGASVGDADGKIDLSVSVEAFDIVHRYPGVTLVNLREGPVSQKLAYAQGLGVKGLRLAAASAQLDACLLYTSRCV